MYWFADHVMCAVPEISSCRYIPACCRSIPAWRAHVDASFLGDEVVNATVMARLNALCQPSNTHDAHITYDMSLVGTVIDLFEQLQAEHARRDPLYAAFLTHAGHMMAIIFARAMLSPPSLFAIDTTSQRVLATRIWLDRHYQEQITVGKLAAMASLCREQYSRLFHHLAGVPPKVYLQQLRLRHAATLLEQTHETIENIALLSGFAGVSYFIRAYKKHYHLTPLIYRAKHLQAQGCTAHTVKKREK